jgi:hypothetical protein
LDGCIIDGNMPTSKYKFLEPGSYDHEIGEANGSGKVGELRLKPSSILWKPKGKQKYFSISIDQFAVWIEANGNQVKQ